MRKAFAGLLIRAAHRIYRPTVAELGESFTVAITCGEGWGTKVIPFSKLPREADGSLASIPVVVGTEGSGQGGGGGGTFQRPDDGSTPALVIR